MRVADLDLNVLRAVGTGLGLALGLTAARLADFLPGRCGITHLAIGARRTRRNGALIVLSSLCALGIAEVLSGVPEMSLEHAALLLTTHAIVAAAVLAAAAIDLEHMILPNELTLGPAVLCLATSPFRSLGLTGSLIGAGVGLAISYLPLFLYKKLRGQSGMGLGDAKLTLMAGAWHGIEGAFFVLFAGALQLVLTAVVMRATGLRYEEPASVKAEIAELRARAAFGDEEATSELSEDPMAANAREGTLGMRLPLGPFLALACIEFLFARRWLIEHVLGWLSR